MDFNHRIHFGFAKSVRFLLPNITGSQSIDFLSIDTWQVYKLLCKPWCNERAESIMTCHIGHFFLALILY